MSLARISRPRAAFVIVCGLACGAGFAIAACQSFGGSDAPGVVAAGPDAGGLGASDAGSDAAPPADGASVDGSATDAGPLLVFLLSAAHNGAFGTSGDGLTKADDACRAAADTRPALKGRRWVAWLSTSTVDAKSRVAQDAGTLAYVLPGGTLVFPAGFPFGGLPDSGPAFPLSGIHEDENGMTQLTGAWTGTNSLGVGWSTTPVVFCNDWTSAAASTTSMLGASATTAAWTKDRPGTCDVPQHLYCFEIRN